MRGRIPPFGGRRGATLVLTAVMMTAILGFVALAVDTMVLAVARHQLGIAADAGALAGAAALADERRIAPDPPLDVIFAAAHDRARQYAQENPVLGLSPVILSNSANDPVGDVVLGYIADPTHPASPFQPDSGFGPRFNTVQVRAARSPERGGIVPAFFARALGFEGASVRIVGSASALNYRIEGFRPDPMHLSDLLPIVLDRSTYESMTSSSVATTDQYHYDPDTGTVSSKPDGVQESLLYPVRSGHPGNWGTVNIGVFSNSTSTLGDQIRYGVTAEQLATYPNGRLELDRSDAGGSPYTMVTGDPGISSGIKDDLTAIIGQPRTIPIYDPAGSYGSGNTTHYKIVGFAPVRVLAVNFKGNPKHVIVQPALTQDPTAIPGELQPTWEAGGLIRLHLTR